MLIEAATPKNSSGKLITLVVAAGIVIRIGKSIGTFADVIVLTKINTTNLAELRI